MFREKSGRNKNDAKSRVKGKSLSALHAAISLRLGEGRYPEAERLCEQALALAADDAETLYLTGMACFSSGSYDTSVEWFSRAIRQTPKPVYLANLATALAKEGRIDQALQVGDKAVQLAPNDATLWAHLGNLLLDAARNTDALLCFRHAIELDEHQWEAAYKAGHLLHGLGKFEEALVYLDRSIQQQPDHAPALHMRALVRKNLNRLEDARDDGMRAVELDPANADTCSNLGNVLQALGRQDEAVHWFDRSLSLAPDVARTITNRAISLVELCRFDEAKTEYQRSMAIDPRLAVTGWNLALVQLLTGEFETGWRGREVRWQIPHLSRGYPELKSARWLGAESIAGKTLLVCADEGLGDTIQFARYIPLLAAGCARIILLVEEALIPLLSGMDGIAECVPKRDDAVLPAVDFHCALDSLPLVFGTRVETIPAPRSYLPRPPADRLLAWERRLGAHDRLRVGLVWSGNPGHHNDRNRSTSFKVLSHLLDLDVQFVSLQKHPRAADREILDQAPEIIDLADELVDFSDTAALISSLDLVIGVDTSVVHLAAALGCPTWVLLPYVPDYRWLLDREDSPWYPTIRLFRQLESREYDSVVARVREALIKRLEEPARLANHRL